MAKDTEEDVNRTKLFGNSRSSGGGNAGTGVEHGHVHVQMQDHEQPALHMNLHTGEMASDATKLDVLDDINFDEIHDDLKRFQQDKVVSRALSEGVDLRQYARKIDVDLDDLVVASVADYIQEADHVAELYTEIQHCDGILEKMQTMLSGFQVL